MRSFMMRFLWVGTEKIFQERFLNIVNQYFSGADFNQYLVGTESGLSGPEASMVGVIVADGRFNCEEALQIALNIKKSLEPQNPAVFLLVSDEMNNADRLKYAELGVDITFTEADGDYTIVQYIQSFANRYLSPDNAGSNTAGLSVFKKLSEFIPGVIFQFQMHPDGQFSFPYVSRNIKNELGNLVDEISENANRFFDLVAEEDLSGLLKNIDDSFHSGEQFQCHFRVKHPSDELVWVNVISSPEKQSDQSVLWYGIATDYTQFIKDEENRKLLSLIAGNTDNIVIITDKHRNIEWVNKSFTKLTGYSPAEVVGKSPGKILQNEKTDPDLQNQIRNLLEKGLPFKGEILNYTKSGESYWIYMDIQPVFEADGTISRYIAIGTDITQQKHREEQLKISEERFRMLADNIVAILDASPAAIIVINMDEKIEMCNRASEKLFGHNQQKMVHHRCGEFIGCIHHGKDGKICGSTEFCSKCALYKGIKEVLGGTDSYNESEEKITLLTDTGPQEFWLNFSIESIILNGKRHAIVALTDVTKQKESQQIENKLLIAENTARIKQNFLSNMSHEMRTPLNGIIGISDILKKTQLDDEQRNYLRILGDSSRTLLNLINSVLDLSKIEAGKVDVAFNTLETAVFHSRISSLFNALAGNQNLEFMYDVPDDFPKWFVTDESKLNQITTNLLGNAIKFTEKGFVKFEAKVISENESHWVLRFDVSDTGRGIPKEKLEEIFDQFTQVDDSKTRHLEGTGLGLAISRNLVNILGGDIHVESEPGKGSRFWFTIRAEKPDEIEFGESDSEESMDYVELNLKVLIVEDLKVNRLVVNLMLQSMGCETDIAVNGLEALHKITGNRYDLVLMDIQMPVMDGLTAVQELRNLKIKLPVIIGLSAEAMEGDAEKYITAGMDDYMTKPVKSNLLAKKLIKWKNKLLL